MNEADARAERIDPNLASAGRITGDDVRVSWELHINYGEIKASGIRAGKQLAGYILRHRGIPFAVVEAKSGELAAGEGLAQAKLYAEKPRLKTIESRISVLLIKATNRYHLPHEYTPLAAV